MSDSKSSKPEDAAKAEAADKAKTPAAKAAEQLEAHSSLSDEQLGEVSGGAFDTYMQFLDSSGR